MPTTSITNTTAMAGPQPSLDADRMAVSLIGSNRIASLDIIRAMAFFAVLTIHALIFANLSQGATAEDWPARFADVFIRGKGISCFSMLFGIGFLIQFERAAFQGRSLLPFALRRLGMLFVLGALHYRFVWTGDVLILYATLGFALLPFLSARPRTLLAMGASIFLILSLVPNLAHAFGLDPRWAMESWHHPDIQALGNKPLVGLFGTEVPVRMGRTIARMLHEAGGILPLFYLGAALWRTGIFDDSANNRTLIRRTTWICLPLGLGLSIFVHVPFTWVPHSLKTWGYGSAWSLLEDLSTFAMALGYVTGLLQLLAHASWARGLSKLAPLGRMALTNYLTHTFLLVLFLKAGRVTGTPMNTTTAFLVAGSTYLTQLAWSHAWLRRFRFGPLEWGWRCITYLRWEPIQCVDDPDETN